MDSYLLTQSFKPNLLQEDKQLEALDRKSENRWGNRAWLDEVNLVIHIYMSTPTESEQRDAITEQTQSF